MRLAGHAVALMVAAILPGGNLTQWVAGIVLLFAGAGCGSIADNQALRYGGGVRV